MGNENGSVDNGKGNEVKPEGQGVPGVQEPLQPGIDPQTGEAVLQVNGALRKLTKEETLAALQKSAAADENFRKAAEMRAQAQEALQFQEDIKAVQAGNEDAFRRVAQKMGRSPEDTEKIIRWHREQQIRATMGESAPTGAGKAADEGADGEFDLDAVAAKVAAKVGGVQPQGPVTLDRLDPGLQSAILRLVNGQLSDYIKFSVDNDPVLGKFMKDGTDKQRTALGQMIYSGVQRRVGAGQDILQPGKLQEVLQEARAQLDSLGVRPGNAQVPIIPGLGSSAAGSPALYQSEKPQDRPKTGMDDAAYDGYLLDKLLRSMNG